ncbi:MAG: preprotein translocase subunit SecG [Clostridia bacterium]|nr:preprotein translocase subunit SecG [Clostridia bacterium]
MFLQGFLGASTLPEWVTASFPVIRIIMIIILAILALTMIVLVLVQEGHSSGTNVLSGVRESFYSQNKSSSKEGRLKKLMTIAGIAFVVITILYFITLKIYNG